VESDDSERMRLSIRDDTSARTEDRCHRTATCLRERGSGIREPIGYRSVRECGMVETQVSVEVQVHALGPLRVTRDGDEVPVGGPRQRRLLAVLLVHSGAVVSVDRIAEAVFAGDPTPSAPTTLRSYVARLRKVIGDRAVITRPPGYQLVLTAEAVDVVSFEAGVEDARRALMRQDPGAAIEAARRALALWQGDAYAEFADEPWAWPESQRLAELRLSAHELLIEALLAAGRTTEVLPLLETQCQEHRLREGFRGQLMTAYYRVGRQADALAEYRSFRSLLADELGIDPSPALSELEARILAQDPLLAVGGEPLRGYRVGERLGTGRDGTVHAAWLAGSDRTLVIRTIRVEMADDPEFIRVFEASAHRVSSLRHAAVLPIYDYWREPGAAYVVMPRMPGGTLRDRLARGPLPRHELVALVERVGGALVSASSASLVHGRVSADNVLYDSAGEPVLADFWVGGGAQPSAEDDVLGLVELMRTATGSASSIRHESRLDRVLDHPGRTIAELVAALLGALGRSLGDGRRVNPYRGLRAFDEADAENYFGRSGLVEDVVERLSGGARLVLLVGASGTGKSSVVRAGVLPQLRMRDWFVATMLPGGAPYAELAVALTRVAVAPVTADELAGDGIDNALRRVLPEGGRLLLVIDQFEELFTLSREAEQRAFLAALTDALTTPDTRLRVVGTLRADHYDRPLAVQPFGSLVGEATVAIPAMLPAEIEDAIVMPAQRIGRSVDRALAAELVGAVASEPAALPALQFVLFELAERGELTLAAYQELGGLEGAIASRAEELYQALDDADRIRVRALFERLVVVEDDEPTRRRATRDELFGADAIVDRWTAARLLSLDVHPHTRAPTVEVAHEALVREWPRLREWVEADRADLLVLARIRASARTWEVDARDPGALLRGAALQAALEVTGRQVHLTGLEREYIDESRLAAEEEQLTQLRMIRRQARTNRRLRLQLGGIAAMLVLALVGGFVALDQRREAVHERHTAVARELAAAADENIRDDPERSILLGLAAVNATRVHGEPVLREATDALHRAISSDRVLRSFPGVGGALAWSPDGRLFSTEGPEDTGLVLVQDARTGAVVRRIKAHAVDVNDVGFSPDSRLIGSAGDDGYLRIWDIQTGRLVHEFSDFGPVRDVVFSPDGKFVAGAWPYQDQVRVFRVADGGFVAALPVRTVFGLAFSPDSTELAASPLLDQEAKVFDLTTRRVRVRLAGLHGARNLAWSPDGRWIAAASSDGAFVYDARTGRPRSETHAHSGAVATVAWSPDSTRLATGGEDGTAKVFSFANGQLDEDLTLSSQDLSSGVLGLAFSPDGEELMTGDYAITSVKVWDLRPEAAPEVVNIPARLSEQHTVALADDTTSAWLPGSGKNLDRIDLTSGERLEQLPGGVDVPRVVGSPDGSLLAVVPHDAPTFQVWRTSGHPGPAFVVRLPGPVGDLAWNADGSLLAVSFTAGLVGDAIRVIDRSGNLLGEVRPGTLVPAVAWAGDRLVNTTKGERDDPTSRGIDFWDWRRSLEVRRVETNAQVLTSDPTGGLLATAGLVSSQASVRDATTGKRIAALDGHTGPVVALAFDGTGSRVATASTDGTVRVWQARTGESLAVLRPAETVAATGVLFTRDGRHLVTMWDDGVARVWTLDTDELVRIASGRLTRGLSDGECERYLHVSTCPKR
jgi:WD40 repeat protein/DNA-binding SARP family transcriptional activator